MMVTVMDHHARGEGQRARDLFDATLPLARFVQQPGMGIGMRKYTLAKGGIIAHDARSVDQIESWAAGLDSVHPVKLDLSVIDAVIDGRTASLRKLVHQGQRAIFLICVTGRRVVRVGHTAEVVDDA